MFYKGRIVEEIRSLYAQRSVLRRTFFFNAEVVEYSYKSSIASQDHMYLAQEGIDERIPVFPVQSVNTSPTAYPLRLHYIYRGRMQGIFGFTVHVIFNSILRSRTLFS